MILFSLDFGKYQRCKEGFTMPWKKAWPTQLKNDLKKKGLGDKDIATLEGYGSIDLLKKDPKKALKTARADELAAQLKSMGIS
jgi:hypothetical protein